MKAIGNFQFISLIIVDQITKNHGLHNIEGKILKYAKAFSWTRGTKHKMVFGKSLFPRYSSVLERVQTIKLLIISELETS